MQFKNTGHFRRNYYNQTHVNGGGRFIKWNRLHRKRALLHAYRSAFPVMTDLLSGVAKRYCRLLLVFFCSLIALAGSTELLAQAAPVEMRQSISLGAYVATGDYGEAEDTRIRYFPLSYERSYEKWGFQLLVPHLEVSGLGNVLVNVGGITRAVAGTQRETTRGIGDTIGTVIYHVDPISPRAPLIDLRADIKIPTADEKNSLGTGETDFSVQVDLSKAFNKVVTFASIGRNFRGKSSLFPGLQDASFVQLGTAVTMTAQWNVGVFYDYREAASSFSGESHELVPYFSLQLSDSWVFTGLITTGFTDASADVSAMGQLSYRW